MSGSLLSAQSLLQILVPLSLSKINIWGQKKKKKKGSSTAKEPRALPTGEEGNRHPGCHRSLKPAHWKLPAARPGHHRATVAPPLKERHGQGASPGLLSRACRHPEVARHPGAGLSPTPAPRATACVRMGGHGSRWLGGHKTHVYTWAVNHPGGKAVSTASSMKVHGSALPVTAAVCPDSCEGGKGVRWPCS